MAWCLVDWALGTGFNARTEVYLSFLSFFTCVSRVILTIPSQGELRLPNNTPDSNKNTLKKADVSTTVL